MLWSLLIELLLMQGLCLAEQRNAVIKVDLNVAKPENALFIVCSDSAHACARHAAAAAD